MIPMGYENLSDGKMITVGTPGLGVRHPHGSTLAFFHPDGFHPGGFHPDDFPSKRFSIRLADAQTGRPNSGSIPFRRKSIQMGK
jgi:hypothetical protein